MALPSSTHPSAADSRAGHPAKWQQRLSSPPAKFILPNPHSRAGNLG